nr:MAG TPA: hypothetical protein [Caudoviricetes sp.]
MKKPLEKSRGFGVLWGLCDPVKKGHKARFAYYLSTIQKRAYYRLFFVI